MFYINLFFIYSLIGFIFENIICLVSTANFNSGILYGPWTFIYAIGMFAMMFLDKFLKRFKIDKWLEIVLFYIFSTIIMTLIEFSGGMIIEKVLHRVYWDYTNMAYNFGHYITLEIALFWGLFATIVNYLARKHIEKFAKKIPKYISIILIVLFIVDIVMTVLN